MRVLLVSGNRDHFPSPVVPLGVLSVASPLLLAGHDVRLCDLCFEAEPLEALRAAIRSHEPEVVGIGIRNLDSNAYDAGGYEEIVRYYDSLVKCVREVTAAKIIMGGSGFSLQPKLLMDRFGADHGIVGEGERALVSMVDALSRGETPPPILRAENVVADHDGPVRLRLRRSATIASDLDLLPAPARELVDARYYAADGTDNIQTKRGCAFGCSYCDYPDLEGRKVRVRDPASVADEFVERAAIPGVGFIFVVDSVFNVPPKHALAVCRELVARGSPVPWACYGSPAAFDDELVAAMVAAGCQGVEVGSDSGTERVLKRLRKPFSLKDIEETRSLFLKHGLLDSHTFVLGAEDETPEEVERTLDFVDRLDPDVAIFVVFHEERESRELGAARHREGILKVLSDRATKRAGWVVPELRIRFGGNERTPGKIGPRWIDYARFRRRLRRDPSRVA